VEFFTGPFSSLHLTTCESFADCALVDRLARAFAEDEQQRAGSGKLA
jgi:hypothetical protein